MTAGPARTGGISDLLDGLEAAAKAATPGPWTAEPNFTGGWALARARIEDADGIPVHTPSGWTGADAACIVAEHNAAPLLVAALRAVLALADELDGCEDPSGETLHNTVAAALGAES